MHTTQEERVRARDVWLHEMRKAYRKRVRELHPDLNAGDEAKAAELRSLVSGWQDIERWQPPCLLPRQQQPQGWITIVTDGGTSSTTTAWTNATGWWPRR